MLRAALVVVVLLVAGLMAYVRLSPNPPARWHVDPVTAGVAGLKNGYLLRPAGGDGAAPVYAMPPADLAARIDAVARAWPRTQLFAGSVVEGWMTYITRSRLMGYPDFTNVRVLPAPGGASFAAFARARFGDGDWGVNKARLTAGLARLN